MPKYRAVLAEKDEKGYRVRLAELATDQLAHDGEVLVEIAYSSLNYKDALAVTGRGKIVRKFPMVLGIDLAGKVIDSRVPDFKPGDAVLAVGQGLGESVPGGLAQKQRVKASALVPVPQAFSLAQAMAIGTAGFTAMLCVIALEHAGVRPGEKELVVTGATGGVGSIAVIALSQLGYRVAAVTGRPQLEGYLRALGAASILPRQELEKPVPPLASERFAGAVDAVGGPVLASLIAQTQSFGAIAACGMAGGAELHTSVFPFILRNISLLGINSTQTPRPLALDAWRRLAQSVPAAKLDAISRIEPMSRIEELSLRLLEGGDKGRIVIDVNA